MLPIYGKQVEDEYLQDLKDRSNKVRIKVLVLGPNTDAKSNGARLRKYIAVKCKKEQKIPIYAERKRLMDGYAKEIGKYADFCHYEKDLAVRKMDAIIIIPGSAGSFIELGLFAHVDGIHQKTLVLFNNQFPSHTPTFINLGPRRSYKIRGADVHDVDYTNKKAVWVIVDDFLARRKAIKFCNTG